MSTPIRVCLVEDHQPTRVNLIKLLKHAENMVCLGAFGSAEEAEKEIPKILPDVVLMDINLGGRNGIECVKALKYAHPKMQFMMLTTYDEGDAIFNSLRVGASGYLLKRSSPEEILGAIEELHNGGSPMSLQIARQVVAHFHQIKKPTSEVEQLTKREQEVLELLAQGAFYKEIGEKLGLSTGVVRNYLHRIYGKLHVQSRTEAVLKFLGH